MSEWNVLTGTYDAATNLAIDDFILEKAQETGEKYMRVYDFERPAVILARNEHFGDIKGIRQGYEYTRRETGGSVIHCDDNAVFYSLAIPTGEKDYPENLHREYFGPRIADALVDIGVNQDKLGIGEHFSVRIEGGTVSGNSQRKKNGAVLYHGVLAVEPWDVEELDDLIHLRERGGYTEKQFIDSLPGVAEHIEGAEEDYREALENALIDSFTGGSYGELDISEEEWAEIKGSAESKYRNDAWIREANGKGVLEEGQGFCFVDWTDEWTEDVERYGFY